MKFGVTNNNKQWYCNYIKPRRFRVVIVKNKSEPRQLDYLVLQGSIHGAFLFISYASTLDEIVKDLTLNGFADDHSVRKTFKPSWLEHQQELNINVVIEKSMFDIKSWIDVIWMKMNDNKTEFICFWGSRQLEKCTINQIKVNGEQIPRSHLTRYLRAYLDLALTSNNTSR